MSLLVWTLFNFGNTTFVLSAEDLEEKGQQLQELQLEVERLTAEHANAAEKFSSEIDRVVAEGEEKRRDLQAHFDATLMEKAKEYEKLEEQLASLKEDYARQVCVLVCSDQNVNSPWYTIKTKLTRQVLAIKNFKLYAINVWNQILPSKDKETRISTFTWIIITCGLPLYGQFRYLCNSSEWKRGTVHWVRVNIDYYDNVMTKCVWADA